MAQIELNPQTRQALTETLKQYLDTELGVQLGGFETQFLLDFFAEQIGCYYYNQGLADALTAMQGKLEECSELVYELEQAPPTDT